MFADINDAGNEDAAAASKPLATHPEYTALALHVDVADEASVKAMVDETLRRYGRIDYCVHSAGVCQAAPSALPPTIGV